MDLAPTASYFEAALEALVRDALCNHPLACEAAEMLWSATHIWDDLIDDDKAVTPAQLNGAFWVFAVGLWRNGFWRTHQDELMPLLEQGIYDWLDANHFERAGKPEVAFTMRGSVINVIVKMAQILGGLEHARKISPRLKQYLFDDFKAYLKEHGGTTDGVE